jgi:hypothetical protein
MAIRRLHVKTLLFYLAQLNLKTEFVDMGYDPAHGLIIAPSNFVPPVEPTSNGYEEPPEEKTDIKINPNASIDDLLG